MCVYLRLCPSAPMCLSDCVCLHLEFWFSKKVGGEQAPNFGSSLQALQTLWWAKRDVKAGCELELSSKSEETWGEVATLKRSGGSWGTQPYYRGKVAAVSSAPHPA